MQRHDVLEHAFSKDSKFFCKTPFSAGGEFNTGMKPRCAMRSYLTTGDICVNYISFSSISADCDQSLVLHLEENGLKYM